MRHLLKHKRRYAPEALTAGGAPRSGRKTLITRIWMATGKKVYYAITRGLQFHRSRRPRLALRARAPEIAARLRTHPQVRDVAIVPFPTAAPAPGSMRLSRATRAIANLLNISATTGPSICRSSALPRDAQGEVRSEILELVAMNQLDLIAPLIKTDAERDIVGRIVSERRNLRDRVRVLD